MLISFTQAPIFSDAQLFKGKNSEISVGTHGPPLKPQTASRPSPSTVNLIHFFCYTWHTLYCRDIFPFTIPNLIPPPSPLPSSFPIPRIYSCYFLIESTLLSPTIQILPPSSSFSNTTSAPCLTIPAHTDLFLCISMNTLPLPILAFYFMLFLNILFLKLSFWS